MSDVKQLRLVGDDGSPAGPAPTPTPTGPPDSPPTTRSLRDYGDVLTIEEAASVLRISRASAYAASRVWRATGREGLPVIQIGHRLLVPRITLEEMLASAGESVPTWSRQTPDDSTP